MNIDKLAADASKLSIPQLQQAMRDGTLPPYVGLPILQQKSQLAKQAQAAQAAGQPRPPTVAEQVDGEASQAQSVQDMMKQRALAMQGEMAGTGGLGSFVREPEKKMALGGAVAFSEGREVPDIGAIYEKMANGVPLTADELKVVSGQTKLTTNARYPWLGQTPYGAPAPQRKAIAQPSTGYVLNPSYELPTELPALAQDTGPDINALSAMVREAQSKAAPGAPQQDMQVLTKSLLKDRSNYIGANKLPTEDITTAKPSVADSKQRYRTVLPSGDITTAKPIVPPYVSEPMPEMQSLTRRMIDEGKVPSNVGADNQKSFMQSAGDTMRGIGEGASNLYQNARDMVAAYPEEQARRIRRDLDFLKQHNPWGQSEAAPQVAQPQATQTPTAPAVSSVLDKGIPYRPTLSPEAQAYNQRLAAKAAQDQVATKYGTTVPAGGIAQNPAVQQEPAQERKSLADYRKEYMDLAGPNQSLADLKSFLAKQGEEYTEDKKRAPWMALMQAGLATMAGTSPFALANIGAGGMKGLEAYGETQKDLKKAQDRQFDLQAKIGAAQRAEDLAALHYGTDSVKFDKAEANKERLLDKEIKSREHIADVNARIQAQHYANQLELGNKQIEALAPVRQSQVDYRERVAANNEIKNKIALLNMQLDDPTKSREDKAILQGQINNLMKQLGMSSYGPSALAGTTYDFSKYSLE